MKLFKYFLSQLINNKAFSILFVLNLAIGLSSFVTLDLFKNSISESINSKSKFLLGADYGISSRKPITKDHINKIEQIKKPIEATSTIELFSMVAGPTDESRLVQVKAIESNFPFYGVITLSDQQKNFQADTKLLNQQMIAWLYPELLVQLNVKIGEQIKIGQAYFTVNAVVENDSAEGITTSMAPRLYISLKHLDKTQLVQFGSIAWYTELFKYNYKDIKELKAISTSFKKNTDDTSLKIYTHQDVSEQTARILKYLNDFLGLVSIAALFLSAIGGAFLFRSYLIKQIKPIGIYLSLGLIHRQIFSLQSAQLLVLGLTGSLLALIFGFLLSPFLKLITADLLPFELIGGVNISTFWLILILGCFGSIIIGLPLLCQIYNVKPSLLLRSNSGNNLKRNSGFWFSIFLGFLFLWILSVWQANSLKTGTLFTGLFVLAGLLITAFAYTLIYILNKMNNFKGTALRWAIRDILKLPLSSVAIFLSIGLGMLLLNLIPQIKASINYELSMPKDSKLPSFFLFDIQEEQVSDLQSVTDSFDLKLVQSSPMVRARLKKINDKNHNELQIDGENLNREQERSQHSRNRSYNLSYRDGLGIGETIYKGKPLSKKITNGVSEISVEKRFASRLDVKIGDILSFDIQGVEVKGKIVNLRKVQWTTFQPNFFILFPDGVLNEAPKTFITSVPKMDKGKMQRLQNAIVKKLPNVSIIDVTRLVKRLQGIIQQMSWALQFMTFICLLAGFIVLFSIANYQARQRSKDIALLKSLGASFKLIKSYFNWQFLLLTSFAGLFGISICFILSYFLSKILFDSRWVLDIQTPVLSFICLFIITMLINYFAINKSLQVKPSSLLNN